MSSLQRDNLLINSDFRSGIINQKGGNYEGITTGKYTIDMWVLEPKGRNTSLYSQNGRIAIYQDGTNQNFNILQFVYGLTLNQGYHLHFRYNDKDYDCNLIANSTSYNVVVDNNIEVLLSNKGDSKYTLAINFKNKQSNFIEYIKLEYGDYFTGMPAWNEANELLKCYRYFISFFGNPISRVMFAGLNYALITYELPIKMAKNPKVKSGSGVLWQNDNTSSPKTTNITNAEIYDMIGNAITVKLNGDFGNNTWRVAFCNSLGMEFDAYDY